MKNLKYIISSLLMIVAVTITIFYYKEYRTIKVMSSGVQYQMYNTADELVNGADLIVIGKTEDAFLDREHISKAEENGATTDYYTITSFQLQRTLKKTQDFNLKSDGKLKIIEPVGLKDEGGSRTMVRYGYYSPIVQKKEYILFLKKNDNGDYTIINNYGGRFITSDNEDINYNFDGLSDEKLAEYNKLKVDICSKFSIKIGESK